MQHCPADNNNATVAQGSVPCRVRQAVLRLAEEVTTQEAYAEEVSARAAPGFRAVPSAITLTPGSFSSGQGGWCSQRADKAPVPIRSACAKTPVYSQKSSRVVTPVWLGRGRATPGCGCQHHRGLRRAPGGIRKGGWNEQPWLQNRGPTHEHRACRCSRYSTGSTPCGSGRERSGTAWEPGFGSQRTSSAGQLVPLPSLQHAAERPR